MIKITREVSIDEVSKVSNKPSVKTVEFSSPESWAACFAAVAVWCQDHDFTLVGVDKYLDFDDDEYCVYLFVDDSQLKKG